MDINFVHEMAMLSDILERLEAEFYGEKSEAYYDYGLPPSDYANSFRRNGYDRGLPFNGYNNRGLPFNGYDRGLPLSGRDHGLRHNEYGLQFNPPLWDPRRISTTVKPPRNEPVNPASVALDPRKVRKVRVKAKGSGLDLASSVSDDGEHQRQEPTHLLTSSLQTPITNVLTRAELHILYNRAIFEAGPRHLPSFCLYRNKSRKYFDDIATKDGGIMTVYAKDNSGDPRSAINGRINGLFFMASVKPGSTSGEPQPMSAFGDTRLCVPVENLTQLVPNLYFADFYCMLTPKKHYVTLVMTKPGTFADRFCSEHLISLNWKSPTRNPFLFIDSAGKFHVSAKANLFVECLVTEDVDIRPYNLIHNIRKIGKGQSTTGGRPKNPTCAKCNVTVTSAVPKGTAKS